MGGTGWDWVSSEPWGWLPYHFGGWVNAPELGWAWVPGGLGTWRPATATWVQVNNQLGWIPTHAPPPSSKLVRPAAAPTVILAAGGAGGVIIAGGRVPMVQSVSGIRAVSAPAPGFTLPGGSARQTVVRTSANASTFVQPAPVSQVRAIRSPAPLQAPHGTSLQSRSAGITSMPPSLLAAFCAGTASDGRFARWIPGRIRRRL
jgi:hypothetical protein